MTNHILVVLRRRDRVEEMLPCLAFIVQPGTTVYFLIPQQKGFNPWWPTCLTIFHTESAKIASIRKAGATVARQHQMLYAETRISPARQVLRAKGAKIDFELYSGSLRKIIESYRGKQTGAIILMAGKFRPVRQIFARLRRPLVTRALPVMLFPKGRNS